VSPGSRSGWVTAPRPERCRRRLVTKTHPEPSPALRCTEYFNGACNALDPIVVTQAIQEAKATEARVTGYCAVAGGRPIDPDTMPLVYAHLSDHCPVVVEVQNRDLD